MVIPHSPVIYQGRHIFAIRADAGFIEVLSIETSSRSINLVGSLRFLKENLMVLTLLFESLVIL